MFFFRRKIRKGSYDADLIDLASVLVTKKMKPQITEMQLKAQRDHLFSLVENSAFQPDYVSLVESKIIGDIKSSSHDLLLSSYKRLVLKEKILNFCQTHRKAWRFPLLLSWKNVMAMLLLVVFSFSGFVFYPQETSITQAAKWTFIEQVTGEAYILRDGKSLQAQENMSLEEGDILITKDKSFIVVRFFDDSVSRLGQNTAVEIKKLYAEPLNSATTAIEVGLQEGYVWTKVVNLDASSSFIINTDNAVASVKNKAAFEIKKNDKSTTLMVFDNVVDFSTKSTTVDHTESVVAGFNAKINSEISFHSSDDLTDHTFVVSEAKTQTDPWIALNMNLDKEYDQKIKDEEVASIDKTLSDQNASLSFLQNVKQTTQAVFTDQDFQKVKDNLLETDVLFVKGQKLLIDSNHKNQARTEALKNFYSYKANIRDILVTIEKLKVKDQSQAGLLLSFLTEDIATHKKDLALILPGEKLFLAKQIINEVGGYIAKEKNEEIDYLLADAQTTLLEVQGLIDRQSFTEAESTFNLYSKKIDHLLDKINSVDVSAYNDKFVNLFNQQLEQLKLLTSIKIEVAKDNTSKMLEIVSQVEQTSAKKLLAVYKSFKEPVLQFAFLQELRSIVKNYFDETQNRQSILDDLNNVMKDYPQYQLLEDTELNAALQKQAVEDFGNVQGPKDTTAITPPKF